MNPAIQFFRNQFPSTLGSKLAHYLYNESRTRTHMFVKNSLLRCPMHHDVRTDFCYKSAPLCSPNYSKIQNVNLLRQRYVALTILFSISCYSIYQLR